MLKYWLGVQRQQVMHYPSLHGRMTYAVILQSIDISYIDDVSVDRKGVRGRVNVRWGKK